MYEPLFADLAYSLQKHMLVIRAVWIVDMANQGESGKLNNHKLGLDRRSRHGATTNFLLMLDQLPGSTTQETSYKSLTTSDMR